MTTAEQPVPSTEQPAPSDTSPRPRTLADIDDPELAEAYARLLETLRDLGASGDAAERGGLAVAFSGGVDSTLLVVAAREALGERALAVTVTSAFIPRLDRKSVV